VCSIAWIESKTAHNRSESGAALRWSSAVKKTMALIGGQQQTFCQIDDFRFADLAHRLWKTVPHHRRDICR